jgi:light-regulated signal transduction histidine kinase (bacteriophytochrome)
LGFSLGIGNFKIKAIMTRHLEAPPAEKHTQDNDLLRMNAMHARQAEHHSIELDAAHAEMDELAQTISHDLRSPLTVIGGFTDLLITHFSENLDEKSRHYLTLIKDSTDNATHMLDEILAISRMSRSEIRPTSVDLKAVVDRVVKDLDATKGDRRVIWLVGNLPAVQADPNLMHQVIRSLVGNAFIFTKGREVARIHVGVQDGDHEVIVFVRDNGTGVDLKHRERMFASFQHRKSSPEAEGGSVGLAHIKRIIQRHGGRMWSEAVPDGGAIFYFSLPNDGTEPEFRSERA